MKNIKKIAEDILCENLKIKIGLSKGVGPMQYKSPIPKEVELKLDEDGAVEIDDESFEKLAETLDKIGDDINFYDIVSEDIGDAGLNVFIDFSAHAENMKSAKDVETAVKDIEDEFETKVDTYEHGDAEASIKVRTTNYSYNPSNKQGRFRIEWEIDELPSEAEDHRSKGGPEIPAHMHGR